MDDPMEGAYDPWFDEVREAFTQDVSYSIQIARAASSILARRELSSVRRNEEPNR